MYVYYLTFRCHDEVYALVLATHMCYVRVGRKTFTYFDEYELPVSKITIFLRSRKLVAGWNKLIMKTCLRGNVSGTTNSLRSFKM